MKHRLLGGEFRNRRQNATSIAGQENYIGRMVVGDAGDLRILDIFNRVCATSIFRQRCVVIINHSSFRAEDNVFEYGAEPNGVVNIRLLIGR